jgi:hypothetical protein
MSFTHKLTLVSETHACLMHGLNMRVLVCMFIAHSQFVSQGRFHNALYLGNARERVRVLAEVFNSL